jgi:hypothetical protein
VITGTSCRIRAHIRLTAWLSCVPPVKAKMSRVRSGRPAADGQRAAADRVAQCRVHRCGRRADGVRQTPPGIHRVGNLAVAAPDRTSGGPEDVRCDSSAYGRAVETGGAAALTGSPGAVSVS